MVTPIESSSSIIPTSSSQSVIQPPSDSNTVQDAKKLAKARSRKIKKELLKKMKEAIIDIKMNPHRPKKPASDAYTTDEEEMIVYDVEDEIETNPDYVKENVEKDLYNSDHFPVILSHDSDTDGKTFPPTYSYRRADWALFTQLAVITDAMIKTESVDTAVQEVTNVLITAAELSIPKSSSHSFQHYKPWWNTDCQTAYENQRKFWGIFRRYPTTENLLAFK
ncbi:putative RNA-directed DNA polymerase from transposon X-element [Trichonephila clavipes]|nr:putative RNA-directed DNA polymerase from transposon X-element [Trichonephila clavipes]